MRTIINIILFSSLMFISSTVLALDYDNILQKTIILIFGDQAALDNHHQEKLAQAILDGEGLFDSLTELQKVIVHYYTINPELFNEGLKNGFDIDSGENEVFYAKAMRDALQELDSNSYLSYRGGVYPSGVYSGKFKIGDIIYNNTFTSTSLSASQGGIILC